MRAGCCSEYRCRRSKPIRLMQGGLTGDWFVITDYSERGDLVVANQKHTLTEADAAYLNAMKAAAEWAMANGYSDHPATPGEGELT